MVQPSGRTALPTGAERADLWPRLRNMLVLAGDAIGVLVLIAAVAIIGSRGTSLDFMTIMTGR